MLSTFIIVLLHSSVADAVAAQNDASSQNNASAKNNWEYIATSYGWFPGITTTVETPIGEFESEVDFEEILESLDIAFLGAFEARNGRLALVGDIQFFDIGADISPPVGTLSSGGEIDSKLFIVSAYATYAVIDQADLRLDLGGGLRYTDATFDAGLEVAVGDLVARPDDS